MRSYDEMKICALLMYKMFNWVPEVIMKYMVVCSIWNLDHVALPDYCVILYPTRSGFIAKSDCLGATDVRGW